MTASAWFLRPQSGSHSAQLFCLAHAGTGASAYSTWPAALGDVEVSPLQLPGRENRLAEPHYGTYENLAVELADALEPRLDRPYAFFGHCVGALHAYETVVRLAELGQPQPDCLFVSGQSAPDDLARDPMLAMSEAKLRAELESVFRSREIEPRQDMIDVGLAVLLGDLHAARTYRRTEPVVVRCPIVVLHWADDPAVSLDQLQGWRRYSDSVDFKAIDGERRDFADAPDDLRKLLTGWRSG